MDNNRLVSIAIAEDEARYADQVRRYLTQYGTENGFRFEVAWFQNGAQLLEHYNKSWQIIFLDINIPGMDGMSVAKDIRRMDEEVILMFITGLAQYAIKGYEVNALDFMLKPTNYVLFSMKLDRALRVLASRAQPSVILRTEDGMKKLSVSDIICVRVEDHLLRFVTLDKTYSVFGSLRDTLSQLGDDFAKCSQSEIVNLRYVDELRGDTVIARGQEIHLSRACRKEFQKNLAEYYSRLG